MKAGIKNQNNDLKDSREPQIYTMIQQASVWEPTLCSATKGSRKSKHTQNETNHLGKNYSTRKNKYTNQSIMGFLWSFLDQHMVFLCFLYLWASRGNEIHFHRKQKVPHSWLDSEYTDS